MHSLKGRRKLTCKAALIVQGSLYAMLIAFLGGVSNTHAEEIQLNDACIASALNRTTQVSPDGSFGIDNIIVSNGPFRVRIVCDSDGGVAQAQSFFVEGVPNGETILGEIVTSEVDPIASNLLLGLVPPLTPANRSSELFVIGELPGGTFVNLSGSSRGTFYGSSNSQIATITDDGFVEALTSGRVLITATNEGVAGIVEIVLTLSNDQDNDGLPDDFEQNNAIDTGGSNLARLPGVTVNASSSFNSFSFNAAPENVIDGNNQTSQEENRVRSFQITSRMIVLQRWLDH